MEEYTEQEETQLIDFKNAILALDEISQTFKVDIWIPSKKKYFSFKEIDTKQQKELLGSAMDNSVYNTSFINVFYDILKSNYLGDNKNDVDGFTVYDKSCIAIHLKNKISSKLNVIFDEKNNVTSKIDLNSIVEKFKNYTTPEKEIIKILNNNISLSIELSVPSIFEELQHDKQMLKTHKKSNQAKNNEDVKDIISDAFIMETSKYIKKLYINDNEVDLSLDRIDQKVKLIEKLPSALIQKVLDQISKWKKDIDDILLVEHEDYKKVINIDSLLFLT
jgi:hypothetical protein